jgi:hypothetical protein
LKVIHDSDGKIYTEDGKFLFEVLIREGDEVARRINKLLEIERNKVLEELANNKKSHDSIELDRGT